LAIIENFDVAVISFVIALKIERIGLNVILSFSEESQYLATIG
jgi:hypothetical protein